jgi:hypothetical protein
MEPHQRPAFSWRVIERTAELRSPGGVVSADDDSGRLFIGEEGGRIRIWTGTQLHPTPFLDVRVSFTGGPGSEQGVLGLAFHPYYRNNGFFYVNYTCRGTAPACSGGRFSTGDAVVASSSDATASVVARERPPRADAKHPATGKGRSAPLRVL